MKKILLLTILIISMILFGGCGATNEEYFQKAVEKKEAIRRCKEIDGHPFTAFNGAIECSIDVDRVEVLDLKDSNQ